jgi:hypothetical protein
MIPEFKRTERETVIADAASSEGRTPQERMAMFADLLATIDAIWASLSPEERLRRLRIAEEIDRRPEPWWRNLRRDAIPDH